MQIGQKLIDEINTIKREIATEIYHDLLEELVITKLRQVPTVKTNFSCDGQSYCFDYASSCCVEFSKESVYELICQHDVDFILTLVENYKRDINQAKEMTEHREEIDKLYGIKNKILDEIV